MPRPIATGALAALLAACSGSGAGTIDAAPPSIDAGRDGGTALPEIGSVWRTTVWAEHILDLDIAAMSSDWILLGTQHELGLVSLGGEVMDTAAWPSQSTWRQIASVSGGNEVFLLLTGGGTINKWFMPVSDLSEPLQPIQLENVGTPTLFPNENGFFLFESKSVSGEEWLELIEFNGETITAREQVDDRKWGISSGGVVSTDGTLIDCRQLESDGSIHVLRVDPEAKTFAATALGSAADQQYSKCTVLKVGGELIAVWAQVKRMSDEPWYQYAARLSADGSTITQGPTPVRQMNHSAIRQYVGVGDRVVGLIPYNPAGLYSFDATTFEPLPTYAFSLGEGNQYLGYGMRLMSDGTNLYLAFTYNENGINFNPVEVAKLEPFP